ncbi:hypothetical protein [Deinococcus sp.]|uniref:hypothetical protein n=1 Tax=Deinococcus sp. TaxID=47478 RepID=UPI003CC5748D
MSFVPQALLQLVPALVGALAAALWFMLRPGSTRREGRWWGLLAGLALLAVPSVSGALLTVFTLSRVRAEGAGGVIVFSLLPAALPLLGLGVVIACFFQREDLLRQRFAAAILVGYLARELSYVLLIAASLLLALVFGGSAGLF